MNIKRRQFLQLSASTLIAAVAPWKNLYGASQDRESAPRTDGKTAISLLEPAEILICGSTLFACDLAIRAARSGKRTVLMLDRVNPFEEGVTCLRTWLEMSDPAGVPALLANVTHAEALAVPKEGRLYYNSTRAILSIEDQLSEANVRFYYNTPVAAALGANGKLHGVVFGGKTGLIGVESPVIVDCTQEATVARAAGATFAPITGPRRYSYVAELTAPASKRATQYTAANGTKMRVELHHYYADFEATLESPASGPLAYSEDFERIYEAALDCPFEGSEKRFRGSDGFLCSGLDKLESNKGRIEAFHNLFVFGPHGVSENQDGSLLLKNPTALFAAFPNALEEITGAFPALPSPRPVYEMWNKGIPEESNPALASHSFLDSGFSEPGAELTEVLFTPPKAALGSELIIAGGGTSGNAASYKAGELGFKAVCLERGLELGGTNTIGGVSKLWFGNKTKAFERYYAAMGAENDGINAPGFFKGVKKAGTRVLFHSCITGVEHLNRHIRRVYLVTPFGLTAIEGSSLIDATGDGSLCAWAGCGYTFGGEHDEMTLWASYAGFTPGKPEAKRPFLSPCDERSASDATRFILAMRRNGKLSPKAFHSPHPFYLAPRESRHISCGNRLSFLDVLAERKFADTVLRVESNPDIKGLATSDAAKAGFIPIKWDAVYRASIPYSALIPRQLDNVVLAGKAYGATHDALSLARMQRDLCVMGMMVVESLRLAKERNVLPRDIPVSQLQRRLIEQEMLHPSDIAADDFGFPSGPAELARRVAEASDIDNSLTPSAQLCLLPRDKALAALARYTERINPSLARLLCFLGADKGVEVYLRNVEVGLNGKALSTDLFGESRREKYHHIMPDQGYEAEIALMLGGLSSAKEARTVPLLNKLGESLDVEAHDYKTFWGYVYTLACSHERFASPTAIPSLQRLLKADRFKNRVVSRTGDLRKSQDIIAERHVYLHLALSRAALRCGDVDGAHWLLSFLNEARVCFARCARAELVAATGKDFGFDSEKWKAWLSTNGGLIKPNPMTLALA